MTETENRNCKVHGFTSFKLKKAGKKHWWSCGICLKEQWKKAQARQRKKAGNSEYHKKYNKELHSIRKSLSVYLAMILFAASIKPE